MTYIHVCHSAGFKRVRVCSEVDIPGASYPQGPTCRIPTPRPGYDAYRPVDPLLGHTSGSQILCMTPNGTAITRSPSGNLGFDAPSGAHTHGGAGEASQHGGAVQTNDAPRTGSGGLHLCPSMHVVHPATGGAVAGEMHGSGGGSNFGGHMGDPRLPLEVQSISRDHRAMGGGVGGEALDADGCGSSPHANNTQLTVVKGSLRRASSRMATAAARGSIKPDIPNRNNTGKRSRQRSAGGPRVVRTKKAGSSQFQGVSRCAGHEGLEGVGYGYRWGLGRFWQ